MNNENKKPLAYAVAKKGYWRILVAFKTKEEAERYVRGKEAFLEVRSIWEPPTKPWSRGGK